MKRCNRNGTSCTGNKDNSKSENNKNIGNASTLNLVRIVITWHAAPNLQAFSENNIAVDLPYLDPWHMIKCQRNKACWGLGFRVEVGFGVYGLGFKVWGLGFRVWGSGFGVVVGAIVVVW